MKLLLAFSALLAIAYAAPTVDRDTFPIAVPIELYPAKPQIDITININGVPTPYYKQNLVYIEIRNPEEPQRPELPEQPPQVANPGYDFFPLVPIDGGIEILPEPELNIPVEGGIELLPEPELNIPQRNKW